MVPEADGTVLSLGDEAGWTEVTVLIQCTNTVTPLGVCCFLDCFLDPLLSHTYPNMGAAGVICCVLVVFRARTGPPGPTSVAPDTIAPGLWSHIGTTWPYETPHQPSLSLLLSFLFFHLFGGGVRHLHEERLLRWLPNHHQPPLRRHPVQRVLRG